VFDKIAYSTISFKNKSLKETLDRFKELNFENIELHAYHFLKPRETTRVIEENPKIMENYNFNIVMIDGGWTNFFTKVGPGSYAFSAVDKQIKLAEKIGCYNLRLFFGIVDRDNFKEEMIYFAIKNITTLSYKYPHISFFFENHAPGISNSPRVIKQLLDGINRQNIRMCFDPMNFEEEGFDPFIAVKILGPYISHAHLKTNFTMDNVLSCSKIPYYNGYITIEDEKTTGDPFLRLFDAGIRLKGYIGND
jgi:sugar phosphate isomerase/epimerase